MKKSDEFLVQFEGLKLGSHHFDWEINESFFDEFDDVEFGGSHFRIDMNLLKESNMLILEFDIQGNVPFACDLCLEDISVPVSHKDRLIVKFSSEPQEDTEEMVVLSHNDYQIDVKQFIYEYIVLSVPFRRVCASPGNTPQCNVEVLSKLKEFNLSEEDLPEQNTGNEEENTDWSALNALKDKFRNN